MCRMATYPPFFLTVSNHYMKRIKLRFFQLAFYVPQFVIFITFPIISYVLITTNRNFHACNQYGNGIIVDVDCKQYAHAEFNDQGGNKRLCQFKANAHHKTGHIIPIRYNDENAFLNTNENIADISMISVIVLVTFILWLPVASFFIYQVWLYRKRIKYYYTNLYHSHADKKIYRKKYISNSQR